MKNKPVGKTTLIILISLMNLFFKKSCLMCKLSATIEPGCRLWNPTNLILSCIYNGIEAKVEDLQRIKLSQHSLSNFPNPPSVRPSVAFKEGLLQCSFPASVLGRIWCSFSYILFGIFSSSPFAQSQSLRLKVWEQTFKMFLLVFLSDPGVPGVRSMGPVLSNWLSDFVET